MLILPGNPLFNLTLATATPPGWRESATEEVCMVVDPFSGLMRPATRKEMEEYVFGGEYDERLKEIGDDEPDY